MANTPQRAAGRIPGYEWDPAKARAKQRGETITDVIRRAIRGDNELTTEEWSALLEAAVSLEDTQTSPATIKALAQALGKVKPWEARQP